MFQQFNNLRKDHARLLDENKRLDGEARAWK